MQQQFAHYFKNENVVSWIYQHQWHQWINVLQSSPCILAGEPGVLVPKIEKKELENLEKEFLAKMS